MAHRGVIAGLLAALLTALAASSAEAQPGDTAAGGSPIVLMLVPADTDEDVSRLVVRAVQSQLSDLDVSFRLSPVERLPDGLRGQIALAEQLAAESSALAVFWCDLADREQVFLYLRGVEADRILVRRLEEPDVGGMAEALAIIVRASIGELLRGGRVGIAVAEAVAAEEPVPAPAPVEPAEQPPAPVEGEPAPRVLRIANRIGYVFETYSGEQPATHGLGLGVGIRVHPNIWLLAGYTIAATIRGGGGEGDAAAIRLARHPIHLGLGGFLEAGAFELGGSVAAVVDYVTFEVRELREGMDAVEDNDDVLVSLLPALEARLWLFSRLQAVLAVGAEIPLRAAHYVARTLDGGQEVLLDAWPAQPWILAGLAVELL